MKHRVVYELRRLLVYNIVRQLRRCYLSVSHNVPHSQQLNNKKFELMLTRGTKAYSSSGSVV